MSKNFMMNVPEGFDMDKFSDEIVNQYRLKGFQVTAAKMKDAVKINFSKGCGGINTVLGLGKAVSVTCMFTGKDKELMSVNFTEAEWTSKIIGLVAGFFCCLIPFVTAIVGIFRQLSLPDNIINDIQMIASNVE